MAIKKPLTLDVNAELQLMQTGDYVDIANGGTGAITAGDALISLGAASALALTAETNRATSAEATLTSSVAAAQAVADAAVPKTTTVNGLALSTNITITKALVGLGDVDNTSDINKPVSTAQAAADSAILTTANTYAESLVVGLWDDRGSFNASINTYPVAGGSGASGAILKGDIWTIGTVATSGPLLGFSVGGTVRALEDAPGQIASNWSIESGGFGYVPYNASNPDGFISANQNITLSGDATGSGSTDITVTVRRLNGVQLSTLATGILKNTTGTGAPSIAVPADFPILNQNTTGTASNVTGVVAVANGGTGASTVPGALTSLGLSSTDVPIFAGVIAPSLTLLTNNQGASVPICSCVYTDSSNTFKLSRADIAATSLPVGLVSTTISNGASGTVNTGSTMEATAAQWDAVVGGSGGLVPGAAYFLSNTVAGRITTVVPTSGYVVRIGQALSTTKLKVSVGARIQL